MIEVYHSPLLQHAAEAFSDLQSTIHFQMDHVKLMFFASGSLSPTSSYEFSSKNIVSGTYEQ